MFCMVWCARSSLTSLVDWWNPIETDKIEIAAIKKANIKLKLLKSFFSTLKK